MLIDNNHEENIYIVKAFEDGLFIVTMEFPKEDWTLKQYNEWKYKQVKNAIPLNSAYMPQTFDNSYIKDFIAIVDIQNQVITDELKLKTEDVTIPFLGGIKNFDFRELMKRFYSSNVKGIWDCKQVIREYIKEILV